LWQALGRIVSILPDVGDAVQAFFGGPWMVMKKRQSLHSLTSISRGDLDGLREYIEAEIMRAPGN
jgi:hypothetical protein